MGFFNNFPYTNFHELNLDWLLNQMKELGTAFEDFVKSNKLKYADPFTWDATTSYNPNTMVLSPDGQVVYISLQRAPAGTPLTDGDYWLAVFDASGYNLLQDQIYAQGITIGTLADAVDDLEAGTTLPTFVKYDAKKFANSYIICFGDSNTMPNPPSGYGNWFETVKAYLAPKGGKSYGVSGATIQNDIGGYPTISNQITSANDYPADQVSLVFLMGGINDFHYGTYDQGAFGAACKNTVQAIHSKFPNALIVSMMDCGHQLPNGRMLLYNEAMQRNVTIIGAGYQSIFVSMADLSLQASIWYNQNHYSNTGAYAIAARLMNAIFGAGNGYTPAPRRTRTNYTSSSQGLNGAYDFSVDSITTIDPVNLVRRDHSRIYFKTSFNKGTAPASGICNIPGVYDPAFIEAGAAYVPVMMVRNGAQSHINVAALTNVTPNQAGDGGNDEPQILVKLPYANDGDEVWTGERGYLEIDSVITISDTQGGN